MIEVNKNYSSVTFAHTISGDHGCDRNMTADVAVVFREEFGSPQTADYSNEIYMSDSGKWSNGVEFGYKK